MATKLGEHARIYLTLLACVLFVCMPSGVLHLTLCDCNGILVETHADPCPCELVEQPACCGRPCAAESPGCGHEDESEEPEDSCCTDLSMPDLLVLGGDGSTKPSIVDLEPEPQHGNGERLTDATDVRPRVVRARGPPGGYRVPRILLERASVVLLI